MPSFCWSSMSSLALVFPGQCSQYPGMGRTLYASRRDVREMFWEAGQAVGVDFLHLFLKGTELEKTSGSQLAIILFNEVCRVVLSDSPLPQPSLYMGHSLGEYSALVGAGAIDFRDCLVLIKERGLAMADASRANPGAMLAIRASRDEIRSIESSLPDDWHIANYNSPTQVVLSGPASSLDEVEKLVDAETRQTDLLSVEGAFHTGAMRDAAERFRPFIDSVRITPPARPCISSVTGERLHTADDVRNVLAVHMTHPVFWEKAVVTSAASGDYTYLECGPRKVITSLTNECLGREAGYAFEAFGYNPARTAQELLPILAGA